MYGFDAATGVLVGASGAMTIDAGHGLQAYRTESGGNWDSVATVRAIWRLNGSLLTGTGSGWLARTVSNRDTLVVTVTNIAPTVNAGADQTVAEGSAVSLAPAAFNDLVGLKPSCGLLSTRGVVPACRTLDCVSIFGP